jgi:sugar lactone lactonase YvrE
MSFWKKAGRQEKTMDKKGSAKVIPRIDDVMPRAAIPGGEVTIRGRGFTEDGRVRPTVRFGDRPANLVISAPNRLVVRVPEGVTNGTLTVDNGKAVSEPASVAVGITIAENLHPVANPVVDAAGNIYSTFSGSRGQKVPVTVYKIDRHHTAHPFLNDLMNPTGLAIDHEGLIYVSSRMEGTIYQVTPHGERTVYAQGMGVATGIAFDKEGNLYVGDRTGTVFKINRDRQIFVFATLEPSVAAFHLALGPHDDLFVTGPTTSSYDSVYRISAAGEVTSFYRGLGRPQGLAFDNEGSLYVAASLSGQRGVVRLTPDATAELVISGYNIVGLAFTRQKSVILATNSSLIEVLLDVQGLPF